ncbi:PP2C family protein-serine/threonine phosphatase [Actinoplanes couchii]|uniref:PPM-type phosphatase domain-containing protein n=1 Tax=Actinoplanes couchii TaxID=403638 RepID=A0ABQ3XE55_9ACTN|nr:SpoIIE family protein phosphatase [Actinoplanes couchii]MDR6317192.1 serine/threonine protein phosphatase PrpC [Actinoplanes couchii]GID56685.1 hypothetical protein Aco03nite_050890 [Actinoplanes couchii]
MVTIRTADWWIAGRRLTVAAGSVVGNRYRDNFDVLHLGKESPLAVVADGMGDSAGSTAAGRTAVEVFVREAVPGSGTTALRKAVAEVQWAVHQAGIALSGLTGCTLTAFIADTNPAGAAGRAGNVRQTPDTGGTAGSSPVSSNGGPSGDSGDGGARRGDGASGDNGASEDGEASGDSGARGDGGARGDSGGDREDQIGGEKQGGGSEGDPGGGEAGAWIVQLGDSRVYRVRDGCLELLTADHTEAWLGILHGWYAPGSREAYFARHRLTRYAGHPAMPEPDLLNVSLRAGDLLLLCTDGVSDQIDDRVLGQLLAGTATPAVKTERLLARTLDNGGDDNATAVIIEVS